MFIRRSEGCIGKPKDEHLYIYIRIDWMFEIECLRLNLQRWFPHPTWQEGLCRWLSVLSIELVLQRSTHLIAYGHLRRHFHICLWRRIIYLSATLLFCLEWAESVDGDAVVSSQCADNGINKDRGQSLHLLSLQSCPLYQYFLKFFVVHVSKRFRGIGV